MGAQGADGRRRMIAGAAGFAALAVGLASCGLGGGTIPLVILGANQPGFKMLRPGAAARACGVAVWPYGARDRTGLLEAALAELRAAQAGADVVRDVRISWRGIDLLLAQVGCVSVHGDVGRVISTVELPMLGGHGDHGHHGEGSPHEEAQ